ncbi:hypothetical protein [Caudoviricetes sp.]|nr:hypothetical protein [Caudoviricetes sp.]
MAQVKYGYDKDEKKYIKKPLKGVDRLLDNIQDELINDNEYYWSEEANRAKTGSLYISGKRISDHSPKNSNGYISWLSRNQIANDARNAIDYAVNKDELKNKLNKQIDNFLARSKAVEKGNKTKAFLKAFSEFGMDDVKDLLENIAKKRIKKS